MSPLLGIIPTPSGASDGYTLDVGTTPIVAANSDGLRTRLIVRNIGSVWVYLGSSATVNGGGGFMLFPGQYLDIKSTAALSAVVSDTTGNSRSMLAVWWER